MAKLAPAAAASLKAYIDAAVSDPSGAPGVVVVAVNKLGEPIFEHAAGKIGLGKTDMISMDSVFWIASCTKMITGIACMQLVEQGRLALDDSDQVYKLAPELKEKRVWDNGKLVPKTSEITLRMLLTHTAGFGYSFFDPRLSDWAGPLGLDEFSGSFHDYLSQPLVNQPGKTWEYGISLDWAGVLAERVSGLRLNDYFQENIFKPMGISNISMVPTEDMKARLAYMHLRSANGELRLHPNGHVNRRPLYASTEAEKAATFHSGGAGCFARPSDYAQVITLLLNNGTHPRTGTQILKKETVEEMFTNQIPEMPNFGRGEAVPPPKRDLINPVLEVYPGDGDSPQGWGLSFFLHLHDSGTGLHSKGTAWWAGLPNLYWWADRQRGFGGIVASQILPSSDAKMLDLWAGIEAGLIQQVVATDGIQNDASANTGGVLNVQEIN
ncbi:hypothetical protein LTR20_009533 [Exophiala xenobiotica]|nr:hypothetical protein LTR90_009346 [Exophiala xenobiotica]KAK5455628.1 hypothetical protein LTR20_009533 [Exophiala xenobiotica]KAK5473950.1 hypothetical protein LTR26_009953 [Exophiala xenobiotica]KAK5481559.1 hypothetical protein LTR83_009692 [Exophiala xenobiotica]